MATRQLRIVKRTPSVLAVCEKCSAEFTGSDAEIRAAFDAHTCAPLDSSQNALRVVREATENK
jgi:hypothetical protein